MNTVTYILVSLVINTITGAPVTPSAKFVSGPYSDEAACNAAQLATGIQKPANDTVTVYACRRIESTSTEQRS